jgi:hypothetical protein
MLTGSRPTPPGEYAVRPMAAGDADQVRALVNGQYEGYEGFAHLDDALWQWHREQRPPTMPAQVVVAEAGGKLVGTAALAEVEVLLGEAKRTVTVLSDAVYVDLPCLRDLLACAPQPDLMTLQALDAPERDDLEALGFTTSVGEVSMVLPFDDRVKDLLHADWQPWYVMVESVVGV